jgi:hypothetical protein
MVGIVVAASSSEWNEPPNAIHSLALAATNSFTIWSRAKFHSLTLVATMSFEMENFHSLTLVAKRPLD